MTSVVHAKCPTCNKPLRIPAEWLSRPMKCKHCQQVFVSRAAAQLLHGADVAAGTPPPVALPPPVVRPTQPRTPFSFNDEPLSSSANPRRRRGRGGWLVGTLIGL